eukprot:TRINITY_DN26688_c0_g1_i1.p1 TRINITY_DN26688_c0_g1~~TRINITY_DN26688_c0_g1_i1.p1  ORF type:complete len:175 (-),score=39.42 TRINITY_DN26688_c0_g1_i1:323-847(-)
MLLLLLLLSGVLTDAVYFNCTNPPLSVSFPDSVGKVLCGTVVPKPATQLAPFVSYPNAVGSAGYLLAMLDPDAPSHQNPTRAPIRHWLVGNIPGTDLAVGNVTTSSLTLTPYAGPQPSQGTGFHRYVLFVFQQPAPVVKYAPLSSNRTNFDVDGFLDLYGIADKQISNFFDTEF